MALLPLIRDSLGLSYLQSGLLLSAYTITTGLFQFPGGWLGDRVNRRIVIAIGLAGVSLSAVAVGLSSSYYLMLFVLVVMGIFAGAYHPSALSLLSISLDGARRGRAISLHQVGGSASLALGPILGGIIADTLGWHFAFILLSIPAMVSVPLILKKRFEQQGTPSSDKLANEVPDSDDIALNPVRRSIGIGQALRPVVVIIALVILMQFVGGIAMSFIPIYLVDKHNIGPAYAAMFMGVVRGGGVAGSLLGGWLSDRWGRRNTIFLALVTTGPILYLLTKLPFHWGLIVIFILFGIIMHMRQAAAQAYLGDNIPSALRSTIFGIYFGLSMEGTSVMQPIAGHFMDIFGIVEVYSVTAWICIALSIISLLLAIIPQLPRREIG